MKGAALDQTPNEETEVKKKKKKIRQNRYKEHTNPSELCLGHYYLSFEPQKSKTEQINSLQQCSFESYMLTLECFTLPSRN